MKATFRSSFLHDLKKVKSAKLLERVRELLLDVENATILNEIPHLKKLAGAKNCYRIRIGDLRLGVMAQDDVVEFVRCLDRKDIYKYFPE